MFNSYKSASLILSELESLDRYLINADKYLAHRPPFSSAERRAEPLKDHVELVQIYFERLVNSHYLDKVIDGFIFNYLSQFDFKSDSLANYIKEAFVKTVVFHDFGKINENFQASSKKMNNLLFVENKESPIETKHSKLGAFIFLSKQISDINKNIHQPERGIAVATAVILSYTIFKHHSPIIDDEWKTTVTFSDSNDLVSFLSKYLECYQFDINPQILNGLKDLKKQIFENKFYTQYFNSFPLYSLVRLNFSLLTAADYLATNEYMNGIKISDFGILTNERIEEIFKSVSENEWMDEKHKKRNYNKDTYSKLDSFCFVNPKEKNGKNLNILRQEMAVEIIRNTRNNLHKNLFYIEAPTGGGKTNLSMMATIELLRGNKGTLTKVFYVFPFTTLITQTYSSLKETLGLKTSEIAEIHSKAAINHKWDNQDDEKDMKDDDNYGDDKQNYIDNLFVNFPFCLLSHIKFFDILKSCEKETNYLLHRLSNSIVVIDELQSYPPQHWDKILYFINQYARFYNIRFILMSATLPKLDKLNIIKERAGDFIYLLPNAKELYFRNPNFCDRVDFNFDLLENEEIELEKLANKVLEESKKYSEKEFGIAKPKGSVYTIVEFIFKNTATEFYSFFENSDFFDEVFVLSGTILEQRRRFIIQYLKKITNRKKRILLITTQVVEAGVDIDMDIGFKDRSLIDSDEQLAGRINRNVNKEDCTLFLFNYNNEKFIYGSDKRFEITKSKIDFNSYKQILIQKDFDHLYNLVINQSNEWNITPMAVNFSDYERKINQLKFKSADKDFKLIDNNNISCFVPLDIAVNIEDGEPFFTDEELEFLSNLEIFPDEDNKINGADVFDVYIAMIKNKMDFLSKKIQQKRMQSIMSKFVFSIFATEKIKKTMISFCDYDKSQYGYIYLSHWQDFYNEISGMDSAKFNSNETQFL